MPLTAAQRMEMIAELNRRGVDTSKYAVNPGAAPVGPGGQVDLRQTQQYRDARAKGMAKADEKAQADINTGLQDAESSKLSLGMLRDTVNIAPTGSFADTREKWGKNVGNVLGGLPFIPTKEEASALTNLKTLTSERTLGDVSKLKGPLSDKDVIFLSKLQVDPYATKEHNQWVAETQSWANTRKEAYYRGMQAWMNNLGSPDAKNQKGQTYQQWWGKWSEQNIPRPQVPGLSRRESQNTNLKAQSAKAGPGGARILSVSN